MTPLSDFISKNKEWLFSGLGIAVATLLVYAVKWGYQALRGRRPPDIRVKVMPALSQHSILGVMNFLTITAKNYSSFPAFITGFYIELRAKQKFFLSQDDITGEFQGKRELRPGDSFTFHISSQHLRSFLAEPGRQVTDLTRAFVVDAVGRKYYSSRKELHAALAGALA